eukprot:8767200-Pyramimonas_sp.AAC.1
MVGKQPQPKWRKELYNGEGFDSEFDVKGEFECWERGDQNVTTYMGTNSEEPDWLSVVRRLTWDLDTNKLIGNELGEDLLKDEEIYRKLPEGTTRTRTRLYCKDPDLSLIHI